MRRLGASLAVAAAGLLVLASASPAAAAGRALDPGDSMYVLSCDSSVPGFQLYSVNASTALSTAIGVGEADSSTCAGQPAYNPATGASYYLRWVAGPSELGRIDVVTGVSTVIGEFFVDQGDPPNVDSIAIGADGSAYAIQGFNLFRLNLNTAELTLIGIMSDDEIYAFAFNAVTGKFYALTSDLQLYEVNVTDATLTSLGSLTFTSDPFATGTYSLQFDEAGMAWIEADNAVGRGAGLWSFQLSDLTSTVYSGNFANAPFYTEAVLVIPGKPTLAATGLDPAVAPLWAGGAAIVVLLGIAVMVARRPRSA